MNLVFSWKWKERFFLAGLTLLATEATISLNRNIFKHWLKQGVDKENGKENEGKLAK